MTDSDSYRDMFGQLYEYMKEGTFVDVTFLVGGAKIGAHKVVLSSCSKVFRAMFEADMKESHTQQVEISDVNEEEFRAFLDYVYAKKEENIEKHLDKLVMLADKYDVQPLVGLCEQVMEKTLKSVNAFDYLQICNLYGRDNLKESILRFIKKNLNSEDIRQKWGELKTESPTLASAVLFSMLDDEDDPTGKIESYDEANRALCDTTIQIGSDSLPVHKHILAEKSPRLAALFEKDSSHQIEWPWITVADVKILLDYVYADKFPVEDVVNVAIIKAAILYDLQPLVTHCVSAIKKEITLNIAVELLITSQGLPQRELKSAAMDFIIKNLNAIKREATWKSLAEHPQLLEEIYLKTKTL